MPDTAAVIVEPEERAALDDPATRAERLFKVMEMISDEARRRGLTDEILEEELAAFNAERRGLPPTADRIIATTLSASSKCADKARRGKVQG